MGQRLCRSVRAWCVAGLVVVMIGAGGALVAGGGVILVAGGGVIHACSNEKTSVLSLVARFDGCGRGERDASWNVAGLYNTHGAVASVFERLAL